MFSLVLPFILTTSLATNATSHVYDYDALQYIDPLIGSANGGNITRNP